MHPPRVSAAEGAIAAVSEAGSRVWDHGARVELTVIYLAWVGAGTAPVQRFAASLGAHPAGREHRLVVAWKGFAAESQALAEARAVLTGIDHDEVTVEDDGLDLVSYRSVAERVDSELICFLNTSSVVLANGWLELLARHIGPRVGAVGATGSWESPLSGARLPRRLLRRGRYLPFPNPHLRTNAFLLRRDTALDLWWPEVSNKGEAWELESGTRSITRQVEARGLHAVVAGSDGEGYPRERWVASETFRIGDQSNLLVADNRTRQFADAAPRLRRKLTRLAWGDPPGATPPSPLAQDE